MSASALRARGAALASQPRWAIARAALVLVGLGQAEVGVWGTLSPHGFYASFPGFGHHWVSAMGPYDEHLVRDYAASELGFAVLLICGAVWFARRVVLIAGAAFIAATVPHFLYHLTTTSMMSSTDDIASLGSFALELAAVAAVMARVVASPTERTSQ
jgi:hypothetical protein